MLYCTVTSVIYSNPESGYAVLAVKDTDGAEQKVNGTLPYPWPGENITAYGHWVNHAEYGRQFHVESSERSNPEDVHGIFAYLASGAVKGIGPVLAGEIVHRFGVKALFILEEQPAELAKIRGISLSKAEKMSRDYRRQTGMRSLVLFFTSCGITPDYAVRLYRIFGDDAPELLKSNPYLLTAEGIGAPFNMADRLAEMLGIGDTDPNRLKAGIAYVVRYNERNGHCFIPYGKLLTAASGQLGLAPEALEEALDDMTEQGELIREQIAGQDACYLPEMYRAETETARRIGRMVKQFDMPAFDLDGMIADCEREQGIRFAPQQKEILRAALTNRLLAVTGGPGTGKTTSLRAILRLYRKLGLRTILAAPTGRAAKRMTEVTGEEASTLHRLLGAKRSENTMESGFAKNSADPLHCDALVIDECSMVDIRLMHATLDALPGGARLILVGDAAQLPAVGPGDVFSAILRSGVVPSVSLTEIFRQQDGSRIVRNAHMIHNGEHPDFSENTGDFFRLQRLKAGNIAETVVELTKTRLPQRMGIPSTEIQILTPTRKGDCGTAALNRALQAALNPPAKGKHEHPFGDVVFREGDRVIQTRNDYDILWEAPDGSSGTGIYNGDIGVLRSIDREEQTLTVDYDGRLAKYDYDALQDLEHAWALTVHKAQGSEYRAVILVLSESAPRLMTRTVLYTAVTRARDLLIMVGNDNAAYRMIDTYRQNRRYNALRIRIREACGA
ncbi:MAG: ATP-dependent RecD-like DNA helicase [Oscillospiraceae bacterium]|nr:ATP-dependent RecD-like DNA helicase [Oscillospiraceae bacterium]